MRALWKKVYCLCIFFSIALGASLPSDSHVLVRRSGRLNPGRAGEGSNRSHRLNNDERGNRMTNDRQRTDAHANEERLNFLNHMLNRFTMSSTRQMPLHVPEPVQPQPIPRSPRSPEPGEVPDIHLKRLRLGKHAPDEPDKTTDPNRT